MEICSRITKCIGVSISVLQVAACVSPNIPSLTVDNANFSVSPIEQKLIQKAVELDRELDLKGFVLGAPELNNYLVTIAQPLVPKEAAQRISFHFYIMRSPVVNAFALPNGSIYLTVGLLARLDNEAELAQVLGHEISHVVLRHSLKVYETNRNNLVAAHIADLFLFGTSIAYLPYLASVASYSREQEDEADRIGLLRISTAGYDTEQALRVFDRIQEVKKGESTEGSWYSSHPSIQERSDTLQQLVKRGDIPRGGNRIGEATYRHFVSFIARENIELKLHARQYELALDAVNRALLENPQSPELWAYQGDALRSMADDPKGAARESSWIYGKTVNDKLVKEFEDKRPEFYRRAEEAYQRALSLDKKLSTAQRGMGMVSLGRGDYPIAKERLTAYLNENKHINDREYITNLIKGIEK